MIFGYRLIGLGTRVFVGNWKIRLEWEEYKSTFLKIMNFLSKCLVADGQG